MDQSYHRSSYHSLLTELHSRLSEAARIAEAAEACALAGSVVEGISVSMDIEQCFTRPGACPTRLRC